MNHLFDFPTILNPMAQKYRPTYFWLSSTLFLPQYDVRAPKYNVDPLTAYCILNINDFKLNIFRITQESQDLSDFEGHKST